jgi:hypothetical protein
MVYLGTWGKDWAGDLVLGIRQVLDTPRERPSITAVYLLTRLEDSISPSLTRNRKVGTGAP